MLVTVAPVNAADFVAQFNPSLIAYDTIVCVGCDAHYGMDISGFKKIAGNCMLWIEYPMKYHTSVREYSQLPQMCDKLDEYTFEFESTSTAFVTRRIFGYKCNFSRKLTEFSMGAQNIYKIQGASMCSNPRFAMPDCDKCIL